MCFTATTSCEEGDGPRWGLPHPVTKLQGHHAPVTSVAFNSEDMQLITLDREKTFKICTERASISDCSRTGWHAGLDVVQAYGLFYENVECGRVVN